MSAWDRGGGGGGDKQSVYKSTYTTFPTTSTFQCGRAATEKDHCGQDFTV